MPSREVGDVDPGLGVRAAPDAEHQEAAVVGHLGLEAPLGLVRGREDEGSSAASVPSGGSAAPCPGSVRRTRRPPAAPGSGRRRSLSSWVHAADENLLHDPVGQLLAGRYASHASRCASRSRRRSSRRRRGLRSRTTASGGQGGGAGGAEPARIEQHAYPRSSRLVRRPQHVLVLQAGVSQLEPASPRRHGAPSRGWSQSSASRSRISAAPGPRPGAPGQPSWPRSRPGSPARRYPRAGGTDPRSGCRDSRRPGRRSGAWGRSGLGIREIRRRRARGIATTGRVYSPPVLTWGVVKRIPMA